MKNPMESGEVKQISCIFPNRWHDVLKILEVEATLTCSQN